MKTCIHQARQATISNVILKGFRMLHYMTYIILYNISDIVIFMVFRLLKNYPLE